MNILYGLVIFFFGYMTSDGVYFLKRRIKHRKFKKKADTKPQVKAKVRTHLNVARRRLRETSVLTYFDKISHSEDVNYISIRIKDDVTAQEYFDYIIKGMKYPIIHSVERKDNNHITIRNDSHDSIMIFVESGFPFSNFQFLVNLEKCFKEYLQAGCPEGDEISVEDIVARARGEERSFEELVMRYGIGWRE
ncbi:hypothetical protein DEEACLCL_00118 [Salmonella phage CRW-SP2]|nr:hypothetical protein DEEACLCL_00118 [Salmonella phage CRW-SP2]